MPNLLRPYKNKVICIPVKGDWIVDVEALGNWLTSLEPDRSYAWAKTRRMCIIAFAYYYSHKSLDIRKQFTDKHHAFAKFPRPTDYVVTRSPGDTIKLKILYSSVNEKWNIGSSLSWRLTEKAFSKKNDVYVGCAYNVSTVYIVGWLPHAEMAHKKRGAGYEVWESSLKPMNELEPLASKDEKRWYR